MKGTNALLAVVALIGCSKDKPQSAPQQFSSAGPTAYVASAVQSEIPYKSDTSLYKIVYTLNKRLRTGDSVRVRFMRDTTGGNVAVTYNAYKFGQKDSATFKVSRVIGKKAFYSHCVRVQHGTYAGQSKCESWITNNAAPVDTVPPIVDSTKVDSSLALSGIYIWPKNVTVGYGKTQQFCAFAVFRNGQFALRGAEKSIWTCDSVYHKFAAASIKPTPQQQYIADRLCIKWEATGGTITAEQCGTPS